MSEVEETKRIGKFTVDVEYMREVLGEEYMRLFEQYHEASDPEEKVMVLYLGEAIEKLEKLLEGK